MLSKAPPVPQVSSSQASEEQTINGDAESQEDSPNAGPFPTGEELQNPPAGDRIVEEVEVPANADSRPAVDSPSREVPSSGSSDKPLQKPEMKVHKAADDRLLTWAAVGLTIAIAVLLFKKLLKSSGYGALFMDGS